MNILQHIPRSLITDSDGMSRGSRADARFVPVKQASSNTHIAIAASSSTFLLHDSRCNCTTVPCARTATSQSFADGKVGYRSSPQRSEDIIQRWVSKHEWHFWSSKSRGDSPKLLRCSEINEESADAVHTGVPSHSNRARHQGVPAPCSLDSQLKGSFTKL